MMKNTREYWYKTLYKIAYPVFKNLSEQKLKTTFPFETSPDYKQDRSKCTYLEAFGRSLAGIGPWLNVKGLQGQEAEMQQSMIHLVLRSLDNATNISSPDMMNFSDEEWQPLVDAAFLAQGLLRSWETIWQVCTPDVKHQIIKCLEATRKIKPIYNNWLLFSGMIEAFFIKAGVEFDKMRIDYAFRQITNWYQGDGVYGDGPAFHWDYYNSFVIQPMLHDIIKIAGPLDWEWNGLTDAIEKRIVRYAAIQERMIAPDGSFPPIGRSLTYRFGAFQALSHVAYHKLLPQDIPPSSIRCALTAVLKRTLEAPNTFDQNGWLRIGLCGSQPRLGEYYITTGSLYLCLCGFLPLGLTPDDPFWSDPDEDWIAVRIWNGENEHSDHAIEN